MRAHGEWSILSRGAPDPDRTAVIDVRPSLPEAVRAGILALVRVSQPRTRPLYSQNPQNARSPCPTRGPRRPLNGDRG
jgi:hypothetical protein